jgi:hypothetical protein
MNADTEAVVSRIVGLIAEATYTLQNEVAKKEDELQSELFSSVMFCLESYVIDLGKALGVETEMAKFRDERARMLRDANARIRELEEAIGAGVTPGAMTCALSRMTRALKHWWRKMGFGHVKSINFREYGCEVVFSGTLFGEWTYDSMTPVSDTLAREQWLEALSSRGFNVRVGGKNEDDHIIDCDATRAALTALFREHLPSARIMEHSSYFGCRDASVLNEFKIGVSLLADIEALIEPRKADENV